MMGLINMARMGIPIAKNIGKYVGRAAVPTLAAATQPVSAYSNGLLGLFGYEPYKNAEAESIMEPAYIVGARSLHWDQPGTRMYDFGMKAGEMIPSLRHHHFIEDTYDSMPENIGLTGTGEFQEWSCPC